MPWRKLDKTKKTLSFEKCKKKDISASRKAAEFKGEILSSGPYVVVSPYSAVQEGSVNCFICAGAWADGRSFTGSMPVRKNSDL